MSTAHPWRRNSRATGSSARAPAPPPAAGLRMTEAWIRALLERLVPPPDLEHAVAPGAAQARHRFGERGALAAVRADEVARSPAGWHAERVGGTGHQSPVWGRPRHTLEGGARHVDAEMLDHVHHCDRRQSRTH